jgi:hypothetical protein
MKCMEMIYVLPHKRISNDVIEERTTNEISEIQDYGNDCQNMDGGK